MAGMVRRTPRAQRPLAPRLERLETRALLSGSSLNGSGSSPTDPSRSLLVRFDAGTSAALIQATLRAVRGSIDETIANGTDVVGFSSGGAAKGALGRLKASPVVAYAEPDGTLQATAIIPDDPYFSSQWGLNSIDAPAAWSITTGNPSIIVAVLDTGVDLHNPDLSSRLWTNPTANADGYLGDVHGYNFVSGNGNIQDDNGHGSHVTGILAASGNNGLGIAGVDWNAQIMVLKTLGADGSGSTSAAAQGIVFAVNHGARVISASWGGPQNSQTLLNAIAYANSKGVVFVTAAGNNSSDNDLNPSVYPAAYRLPNELVVAAVDPSGNLASFSNFGASTVDVAAPGVNIFSTVPGGYQVLSGTSMATPYAAGVVSLLAGLDPGLSATQLIHQVIATVKPLPSLAGRTVSGGMVDAYDALTDTVSSQAQTLSFGGGPGSSGLDSVEDAILATDAVYQLYGGSPTSYVAGLYQTILGRAPDPSGQDYYAGEIGAGVPRQDVIHELLSSDEAKRTEVARWYQVELGWNDSVSDLKVNPGVMYWAGQIDSGTSDDAVHAMILAAGIAPGGSPVDYVNGLYQAALGRPSDPSGLAYYSALIGQGSSSRSDIAQALVQSQEGRQTEVARFYQIGLGWTSSVQALKLNPGVDYWAGLVAGS